MANSFRRPEFGGQVGQRIEQTGPSNALWAAIFALGAVKQLTLLVIDFRESIGIAVPHAGTWIGRDFTNFWIAPQLAQNGVNVYNNLTYMAHLNAMGIEQGQHYLYPPATLLFETPFSFLPYPMALALWVGIGLAAFYFAARPYIRFHPAWLLLLPGLLTRNGQWGAFAGALFLWSFRGSGVATGLLTMKPHLGLLLAVSLAVKQKWKQISIAALTCLILWGVAEFAFGLTSEFITDGIRVQRLILTDSADQPYFGGMPSTYIRLRGFEYAWVAHAIVAIAATGIFLRVRKRPLIQMAFPAATATFLILPYGLLYDMAVVSLGFAVLIHQRWLAMNIPERAVVLLAFWAPAITGYAAVPLVLLAGLYVQTSAKLAIPCTASSSRK